MSPAYTPFEIIDHLGNSDVFYVEFAEPVFKTPNPAALLLVDNNYDHLSFSEHALLVGFRDRKDAPIHPGYRPFLIIASHNKLVVGCAGMDVGIKERLLETARFYARWVLSPNLT